MIDLEDDSIREMVRGVHLLLAIEALDFDAGDWTQESQVRHLREQIALAKKHLEDMLAGSGEPDFREQTLNAIRDRIGADFIEFTNRMLGIVWQGCDIDGASVQEIASELGLLEEVEMTEKCGDNCACAEVNEFPLTCYRKTYSREASDEDGSSA